MILQVIKSVDAHIHAIIQMLSFLTLGSFDINRTILGVPLEAVGLALAVVQPLVEMKV